MSGGVPQLPSSLLSPQGAWPRHRLPGGLHSPFPQDTSPGLHDAATHTLKVTYKYTLQTHTQPHTFVCPPVIAGYILFVTYFMTSKNKMDQDQEPLTALGLVPSVGAVPDAVTHLPQWDAAAIPTAELARTR